MAALAVHHARLLHGLYRVFHAAGNLGIVRENLRFTGHGQGVPQLVRVPPHDNRHFLTGHGPARFKGIRAGAVHNALGGGPLHEGSVILRHGNVGEPAGRWIGGGVDTGQPS